MKMEGRCYCGALRYRVEGEPMFKGQCHCRECQYISGGAVNAKLEQSIENHADWVLGVALAPDGKHLLSCSRDKTAKVWDLADKQSVLTYPDHQKAVFGVRRIGMPVLESLVQ